ncbi:hypothetical protein KY285_023721 [Solanum tuberosum]|nr:hypothetical protein KY289_024050 [Solanum tuberosum]KAH0675920.1 hypothetical protein KY285_023721 [Solanum tuberosum]
MLTMVVLDLVRTEVAPKTTLEDESTESQRKRRIKRKGKMVESSNKGDKRRYATRGIVQKLLGDAQEENKAQTERN